MDDESIPKNWKKSPELRIGHQTSKTLPKICTFLFWKFLQNPHKIALTFPVSLHAALFPSNHLLAKNLSDANLSLWCTRSKAIKLPFPSRAFHRVFFLQIFPSALHRAKQQAVHWRTRALTLLVSLPCGLIKRIVLLSETCENWMVCVTMWHDFICKRKFVIKAPSDTFVGIGKSECREKTVLNSISTRTEKNCSLFLSCDVCERQSCKLSLFRVEVMKCENISRQRKITVSKSSHDEPRDLPWMRRWSSRNGHSLSAFELSPSGTLVRRRSQSSVSAVDHLPEIDPQCPKKGTKKSLEQMYSLQL